MDNNQIIALIIFAVTYFGIIFTRLPKMNIDRPSAAFFGAVAMIISGVITFDQAIAAIDFNTIALLLGMMIMISTLEIDGFFALIANKTLVLAKSPFKLLVIITFITGIASAFLVNDAVVLIFTPVVIIVARTLKFNPLPFVIAEILASNTGSAMSMTGNPQNMLIGINSGITYGEFLLKLLPVSILGMIVIIVFVHLFYRSRYFLPKRAEETGYDTKNEFSEYNFASMRNSVIIFSGVLIMFFFSHILKIGIPVIALLGASFILLFGKVKPSLVIKQVDWVLLLFFASLFIVVHGVESTGIMQKVISEIPVGENTNSLLAVHGISLLLSQIISNVPFTVVMLPLMKTAHSEILWLSLASASTLAGNATIIGAMANLIVIESAEKKGVAIRFFEFLKIGGIVTLISLLISFAVLCLYL